MVGRRFHGLGAAAVGAAGALAALALPAAGQAPDGTAASLTAAARAAFGEAVIEAPVRPFRVFRAAQLVSAGTGLRNQPSGQIVLPDLRGEPRPVQRAFLYWTVIRADWPVPYESQMFIRRLAPNPTPLRMVTGTEVGLGPSPCWGGDRILVFRAEVPRLVVDGPGIYEVVVPRDSPGVVDPSDWYDPWISSPLPAYNGASLVVAVGASDPRDARTIVALYDRGLAGRTFISGDGLSYRLVLPPDLADSRRPLILHQINSSAQNRVAGLVPSPELSGEVTRVNGLPVGGPGSARHDGDWNGAAGGPVFQLWDNGVTDITAAKRLGATQLEMDIRQTDGLDCLTPVAVALQG